jgi:hypothetical protein
VALLKPKVNNRLPGRFVELTMTAPDQCIACGWQPPKEPGDSDKWQAIAQFGPVVLMGCPKCFAVMMNKDFASNAQRLKDAKESPIIVPEMRMKHV